MPYINTGSALPDARSYLPLIKSNHSLSLYNEIQKLTIKIKNLEQAQSANQAKTEFIANMSHDLRTPLIGVIGISELLIEQACNKEQKKYANCIHDCSNQLLSLLNEIVEMVSISNDKENNLKVVAFNLKQCIDELACLEMPTIQFKGLELLVNIDKAIPLFIKTDRTKLYRVILNLLGNAIKYTQSGFVTIDIRLVCLNKDNATIYFAVSDTGVGIPSHQHARIFERYHRVDSSLKNTSEGHGLGLHIAQTYVNLLGGNIHLTSEPGKGSTFYFELPVKVG